MKTYKKEISTILLTLKGSPWATHPRVNDVIAEYQHLEKAASTPTASRRTSLQIFHAARAIDSLLAHIARNECIKVGRPIPAYFTLGSSLQLIQKHGVSGVTFTINTKNDVIDVKRSRNTYMHSANCFPTDVDMQKFINQTIRAIGEAVVFIP